MKVNAIKMIHAKNRRTFFLVDLDIEAISSPKYRLNMGVVWKLQMLNIMMMTFVKLRVYRIKLK